MRETRERLVIRPLDTSLTACFTRFLQQLDADPVSSTFHPHPFTADEAAVRCAYSGLDVYAVALRNDEIVAYGMLRGWDEGYSIPSLGIAVAPRHRSRGFGRLMMNYLLVYAKVIGAEKIRLKVYPDNTDAIALYRSLGYQFQQMMEDGQMVGYLKVQERS